MNKVKLNAAIKLQAEIEVRSNPAFQVSHYSEAMKSAMSRILKAVNGNKEKQERLLAQYNQYLAAVCRGNGEGFVQAQARQYRKAQESRSAER